MFSLNCVLLLAACILLATTTATPIEFENFYESQQTIVDSKYEPVLLRPARSPQGGNLNLGYKKDQFGREASVNYNHNLYTSNDGRGSIDAYAQGTRNFDHNRNDFGGGIRGSWKF